MSKRDQHRVVLADFKAKKELEGSIEIIGEKGGTFRIPPPELWPDAVLKIAETDPFGAAQGLLGDEYASFVEEGGSAALLMKIVLDEHGATPGE